MESSWYKLVHKQVKLNKKGKIETEKEVSKGEGQYKVTIGFIDALITVMQSIEVDYVVCKQGDRPFDWKDTKEKGTKRK